MLGITMVDGIVFVAGVLFIAFVITFVVLFIVIAIKSREILQEFFTKVGEKIGKVKSLFKTVGLFFKLSLPIVLGVPGVFFSAFLYRKKLAEMVNKTIEKVEIKIKKTAERVNVEVNRTTDRIGNNFNRMKNDVKDTGRKAERIVRHKKKKIFRKIKDLF